MTEYRFAGQVPYDYPAIRDTAGRPLGTVEPGDVRDLDELPGPWWVLNDPAAAADPAAAPSGVPQPVSPAPVPLPASQTSEAGPAGSEE